VRPMETAPRDGTEILILGPKGWWRAYYVDCAWLRDSGEPKIRDCWRCTSGCGHIEIELDEARGWKPAANR
jgi:hypothetical protein